MATVVNVRPFLAAAGMLLAGCMNYSALDDLKLAEPSGTPFSQALYKNYAFLANSFGDTGQASYVSFDQADSIPLARTEAPVAALANTYASKALALTRGQVVDPEPSRDINTHTLRDRLVRALAGSREDFPRDAARAQADWDCWRLNEKVEGLAASADQCRRSFEVTLVRLEAEAKAVAAANAAAAAAARPAQGAEGSSAPDDTTDAN